MKTSIYLMLLAFLSLSLSNCSSSRATTERIPYKPEVYDGYTSQSPDNFLGAAEVVTDPKGSVDLSDQLRGVVGVTVRGNGPNAIIRIRGGANTFSGDSEPLFVVNGLAVSGGYSNVYSSIHVADIKSINVLKDAVSTSVYGVRGANGVIVIKTKGVDR